MKIRFLTQTAAQCHFKLCSQAGKVEYFFFFSKLLENRKKKKDFFMSGDMKGCGLTCLILIRGGTKNHEFNYL